MHPFDRLAALVPVFLLAALPLSARSDANDSLYSSSELAASSAAPWNPPSPVRGSEAWETALRLPGRIVSLPLSLLGRVAENGMLAVERLDGLDRLAALFARQRALGVTLGLSSLGDRAGLGGELRVAPPRWGDHVSAEISGSLHHYNREALAAGLGPFQASYVSQWRPREPFFGSGMSSTTDDEAAYAERGEAVRLAAAWNRKRGEGASSRASVWAGPRESILRGGRDPEHPSLEVLHPAVAAASLNRRVEHLTYGVGFSHDARSGRPHWFRGWRASVEAERFDKTIEAIALKDAHTDTHSFTRATYQAEAGASFGRDPRTLRLALQVIDQQLDRTGGTFLLSDLSSLGGADGLTGFESGRFRDLDLVHAKLSYLYPLLKNLEFDLHAETGGVYASLGSATAATLEQSFGAALRLRTELGMLGMVGVDRSSEGTRFRFSLGGVE